MDDKARSTARKEIVRLFKKAEVVDRKTGWFHLNRLWFNPEIREKFAALLLRFMESELTVSRETVLLSPEGIVSSYGIVPFVTLLASELKCRMAIWKEFGDVVTTAPLTFPDASTLPPDLQCIVVQDVVSKGTTLRKMCPQLQELNWKLTGLLAVVTLEGSHQELMKSISRCRAVVPGDLVPVSIMKDSEF